MTETVIFNRLASFHVCHVRKSVGVMNSEYIVPETQREKLSAWIMLCFSLAHGVAYWQSIVACTYELKVYFSFFIHLLYKLIVYTTG